MTTALSSRWGSSSTALASAWIASRSAVSSGRCSVIAGPVRHVDGRPLEAAASLLVALAGAVRTAHAAHLDPLPRSVGAVSHDSGEAVRASVPVGQTLEVPRHVAGHESLAA